MKLGRVIWGGLLAVALVGCSGGDEPTAQDDAFMKDLEAAAAKNPNKGNDGGKRMGGSKADGNEAAPPATGG